MRRSIYQSRRQPRAVKGVAPAISGNEDVSVRKHRPDYVLIVLISVLLLWGAVVVYAIGPGLTNGNNLPTNYFSSKQVIAIILGVIAFIAAMSVPINLWKRARNVILGLAIVAALMVRVVGEEINGAHRWIQFGGFSFQVAELIKLALVVWLAQYLNERRASNTLSQPRTFYELGALILAIVVVVGGVQSDLGSAAVMLAIVGIMSFVAGFPLKKIAIGLAVVVLLAGITLNLEQFSYRKDRIATFLNPAADCQNEGYQACQALITVGSGGLVGKGIGRSVQAYGYLPEPANDSIFAIVAEKFGFIGASVMVGIFWFLFSRITAIARGTVNVYAQLIVIGVLVWLSTQSIINIAAMLSLIPLKGITLPFVSYGGTSIIFVMTAMGIVFSASRYTDFSVSLSRSTEAQKKANADAPVLSGNSRRSSYDIVRRDRGRVR